MKKLFSFIFFLLMSAGSAFGATVTIAVASDTWQSIGTSGSGSTTSVTKSGITVSSNKGYKDGTTAIREYSGGAITVSSSVGNITSIAFTSTASGTSNYGPAKISLKSGQSGTYSYSGKVGTWAYASGSSSIIFNATAQFRWTQVVVTYTPTVSYTITAQSNNESYGTVSLSDNIITGSPKSGYRYADPAYSVSPANSATVSQSGNAFTVTPSANTTVTINFEAIPTYTVTYNLNGGTGTTPTETNKIEGATFTLHNGETGITPPGGKMFSKWKDQDDNLFDGGDTYTMPGKAVALTAQWVDEPTPAGKIYELVTDASQLNDNDNIIILALNQAYALDTTQFGRNNRGASQDYRLIMNKTVVILNEETSVEIIKIIKNSNIWELYAGSGYLYAASSSKNYLKTRENNNDNNGYWEITINNSTSEASIVAQGSNSRKVMQYNANNGNPIFACYETASQTGLYIYKESSFSNKYSIEFINQLGQDSTKTQSDLGEIIMLPSKMNICNSCYGTDWELTGWVNSLDVTSPVYTNDYIPTHDISLYALYGRGTEPVEVDEYKRVTEELDDWSGDYLIAYDDGVNTLIADGRTSSDNNCFRVVNPTESLIGGTVVKAEWGDLYNITLEKLSDDNNTYLLKTKDGSYNYAVASGNKINRGDEAVNHPITIVFNNLSDISIKSENKEIEYNSSSNFFRFYAGTEQKVYLYKRQTVTKFASTEYSTTPECDTTFISTWGTGSISIPQEGLPVTNPTHVSITNIEEGTTITSRTSLPSLTNGEYVISTPNLGSNSCNKMNILIEGADSLYMIYKVPILISGASNGNANVHGKLGTDSAACDVVVLASSELELTNNLQNRDVKVYEGGRLSVPTPYTYNMNTLSLRKTDDTNPYLTLKGDISLAGDSNIYFDVYTGPTEWRWLALPETFDIRNITLSNGKKIVHGEDFLIKIYDGEYRATNLRNGWAIVPDNKVFAPGEGFIFGIAGDGLVKKEYRFKFSNEALTREKTDKHLTWDTFKAWGCGDDKLRPNHKGWNLMGNPYMDLLGTEIYEPIRIGHLVHSDTEPWDGKWDVSDETEARLRYRIIHERNIPGEDGNGYSSQLLDRIQLEPFSAFFVQLGGNPEAKADILLDKSNKRSVVARRTKSMDKDEEVFLRIYVGDKKTGFFISNKFTEDYEPGDDFESRQSIYQTIGGYKLLYSAVPDSTLINGVTVTSAGGVLTLDEKVKRELFSEIFVLYNDTWYDILNGDEPEVSQGDFKIYARIKREDDTPTNYNVVYENDENCVLYDMLGRKIGLNKTRGIYIMKGKYNVFKVAR